MASAALAPLPLLAALKHPLAMGGLSEGRFRARVRALELAALRGPRPGPGFAGLRRALAVAEGAEDLLPWLDSLEARQDRLLLFCGEAFGRLDDEER